MLNLGVSMCKLGSDFLNIYKQCDALTWRESVYIWNSNQVSYEIYECNPQLLCINYFLFFPGHLLRYKVLPDVDSQLPKV